MKVVIPIAGVGSRLRPHTYVVPKALIRVAGRRIIEYIMEPLLNLNRVDDFIFILGHLGSTAKEFLEERYPEVSKKFVFQTEFLGLGHAVRLTRKFFHSDEEMMIVLGDIIFPPESIKITDMGDNAIAVMEVDNPKSYGVVKLDGNRIVDMVEKPQNPPSNLAIAGLYYIKNSSVLFSSLNFIVENDIKTRGEYQLTDALKKMLEDGHNFYAFKVDSVLDCGEKSKLLDTNRILLEKNSSYRNYPDSIIIPPVFIHSTATITNSIIGPYVSIGKDAVVKSSIVRNSILGAGVDVEESLLVNSLIGDNSFVREGLKEINIGPDSEIVVKGGV